MKLSFMLGRYEKLPLLRIDTDIMKFWTENKVCFPLLSNVASIILSIPTTEVDVERLFSHLTFVHSKLRNCLTDKIINDILFLRMTSKQHFENIEEEEIL